MDGGRRRRGGDQRTVPFRRASPTPQPCGSSYAGSSPRPVPNWRSSPTTAITLSSPTEDGDTLYLEADHRRHAEIENAIRDLKYGVGLNHLPAGRFPANPEPAEGGLVSGGQPSWPQVMAGDRSGSLDNARRPGRATGNHQDPQAALLRSGRTAHPLGPASHPASAPGLALAEPVQQRSGETARPPTPFLTAPDPSVRLSTGLAVPRQAGTSVSTAAICPADLPLRNHLRSSTTSVRGAHSPHPAESLRIKALQPLSRTSHPCLGQRDCIPSVDSGLTASESPPRMNS